MYQTVFMVGTFGVTAAIILFFHNLIFRKKITMDQRIHQVLGETSAPLRSQELSAPLYQRLLRPLLGGIAGLLLRVIPFAREEVLEKKVKEAGSPGSLNAREWMVVKTLLGLALGSLLGLFLHNIGKPDWQVGMLALTGFMVGWFSVDIWLKSKAKGRRHQVERAMPDLLDLLTVSVEAGLGFEGALMKIAEKTHGLLSDEFITVLREIKMGKSRKEAMKAMAERLDVEAMSNFVASVVMAEQLGVSIGNVLRVQSVEMRQKKRQKAEEVARKAPIKMLIPMVMFIFPAIFIILLGPAVIQLMRIFQEM